MTETPFTERKGHCGQCGAELDGVGPSGLCGHCMLRAGLTAGEQTVVDSSTQEPTLADFQKSFGDYELIEEIARGGMGVVYRARQKSLDRIVAVKMILAGQFAGKQLIQRFRAEVTAAALLKHPNIVLIHEVGIHDGQHFFSMEYVEGQNLSQLVGNRPLPAHKAARYVMLIAEAIHYAHEQGILHRDLKPSNVLIDSATDQPRITDFGLAKRLDGESSLTITGQVLGSPNFMPPEQASAQRGKVGRHSDVYGLGAVLYHLLTARAPFQADSLEGIVTQVLGAELVSPRLLNSSIPRDLETICLKCLEKEPAKRYASAQELAAELDRFLNDEPIQARPTTPTERAWRWCRRKPAVASLSVATVALLLAVSIGSPVMTHRITKERESLRLNLYAADMKIAHQAWQDGLIAEARDLLELHRPKPGQSDLRGFEWRCLWRLLRESEAPLKLNGLAQEGNDTRLHRMGDMLLNVRGSQCKAWRIPTWEEVPLATGYGTNEWRWDFRKPSAFEIDQPNRTLTVHELPLLNKRLSIPLPGPLESVVLAPDQQTLAVGFKDGETHRIMIWDLGHSRAVGTIGSYPESFRVLEFAPDSRTLLVICLNNITDLWDLDRLSQLRSPFAEPPHVQEAQFTRDGQTVVLFEEMWSPSVWVWRCRGDQAPAQLRHPGIVLAHDISPDGARLATAAWDGTAMVWELHSLRLIWYFRAHLDRISAIRFFADNQRLVTGASDRTVRLWDIATQKDLAVIRGHLEEVQSIGLSSDEQSLFTASRDGAVKVWDVPSTESQNQFVGRPAYVANMVIWPDGRRLASAGDDGVRVWDAAARKELNVPQPASERILDLAVSADSRFLAAVSHSAIIVTDLQTDQAQAIRTEYHDSLVDQVKFSTDGQEVAFGVNAQLMVFGIVNHELRSLAVCRGVVAALDFAPDGASLITGDDAGWVTLWDRKSGQKLWERRPHSWLARDVRSSRDGRWLATCGFDKFLKLWRRQGDAYKLLHTSPRQTSALLRLAFSPDGTRLFTASRNGTIKIWGLNPFIELGTLLHPGGARCIVISPDGNTLYSGGWDGIIRIWPADSFTEADATEEKLGAPGLIRPAAKAEKLKEENRP